MILSEVRDYVRERGQVSLSDLSMHFDAEPDVLRGMLEVWIRKGKIHREPMTASCGSSCTSCAPEATEVYCWGAQASIEVSIPGCTHT